MPIAVCTCRCGSSEQAARQFLQSAGYPDWLSIPIEEGKERSRNLVNYLPPFSEAKMLDGYLENASKWIIIVGWNEKACRWADIAHNPTKSGIEAKLIVDTFA